MIDLLRSPKNNDLLEQRPSPGPGYYKSNSINRKPSSFSFSQSERAVSVLFTQQFEDLPGPGSYYVSSKSTNQSTYSFNALSPRFSDEKERSPGPGAYGLEIREKQNTRLRQVQKLTIHPAPVPVSIPLLERQEVSRYDGQIMKASPAEYYPKLTQIKPTLGNFLFAKSKQDRNLWDKANPLTKIPSTEHLGPGKYDSQESKHKITEREISPRCPRFDDKPSNLPGPGHYDPSYEAIKPSLVNVVTNRSKRDAFEPILEFTESKPFKIKPKLRQPSPIFKSNTARDCNKSLNRTQVGPGAYELENSSALSSYSFAMEPRFKTQTKNNPGPGSYNTQRKNKNNPISIDHRTPRFVNQIPDNSYVRLVGKINNPGPGKYMSHTSWLKEREITVPFLTKTARTSDIFEPPDINIDPGKYQNFSPRKNGGGAMGVETRFKSGTGSYIPQSDEALGPGSYSPDGSFVKRTHNITWIN